MANTKDNKGIYQLRDREAGNPIENFNTFEEALEAMKANVDADKYDEEYSAQFYEIYNEDTEEIEEVSE